MTEWIVTSTALILIVIALRGILKNRITARLRYGLWLLVLIRLLLPFSVSESVMSLGNVTQQIEKQPTVQQATQDLQQYESAYDRILDQYAQLGIAVTPDQIREEARDQVYTDTYQHISSDYASQGISVTDTQIRQETQDRVDNLRFNVALQDALPVIWYTGMIVVGLALVISNLRFGATLVRSRKPVSRDKLPVYVSDAVATPCLFGLPFPAIYLTRESMEDSRTMNHVLTHEMSHYRQGDHLWSALRLVCLVLHWYNPLVWLAVHLSKRDAEMACDEATIRILGEDERAAYGRTLIGMTCLRHDPRNLLLSATTMIGSKQSLRERIQSIAQKARPTVLALIACLVVMAIAVGCTFTGAPTEPTEPTEPGTTPTTEPTEPTTEPTESAGVPFRYPSGEGLSPPYSSTRVYPSSSYTFMYEADSSSLADRLGPNDCVEGHVYLQHGETKEIIPLLEEPAVKLHKIADHAFFSTNSGQLIHFSYITGESRVLYEAEHGSIETIGYFNSGHNAMVYFNDGDYVMSYDLYSDELKEIKQFQWITYLYVRDSRMWVKTGSGDFAYDLKTGRMAPINGNQIDAFLWHGMWPTDQPTDPTDPTEPTEPIITGTRYPSGDGSSHVSTSDRVYPPGSTVFIYDPSQAYGDNKTDGYECVEGHIYIKHSMTREILPLTEEPAVVLYTIADHAFFATESGKLMHFSYLTGETRTLYEARYGTVSNITYFNDGSHARVYFTDSDYILSFDLYSATLQEITRVDGITYLVVKNTSMLIRCGEEVYAYDLATGRKGPIENPQIDAFLIYGTFPNLYDLTEQFGTIQTLFLQAKNEDGNYTYEIYHTDLSLSGQGGNIVSLPANYTVEDLIKPWGKDMDWVTGTEKVTVTCSLPYIIPFSADAVAAQQEINEQIGRRYASLLYGNGPGYNSIWYEASLTDDVISVLVWEDMSYSPVGFYLVYNFDLTTGKLLTNAEMLERFLPNVSYPAYCMAVCKLREDSYRRHVDAMESKPGGTRDLTEETGHILSASLYLNPNGELRLAYEEATAAGAGYMCVTSSFPPTGTDWSIPTTQEGYEWLFNITIPEDNRESSYYNRLHFAELLANAYLADPEGFESYLAREDAETQARIEATGFREEASILAGNLSLPENYTLEDLVAAYNEHLTWINKIGDPYEFTLSMPLIYPFSEDAIAVQQLISSRCTTILEEHRRASNSFIIGTMKYVGYEASLDNNILTLVMEYRKYYGSDFAVFNFDLTTGKLLSSESYSEPSKW